MNCLSRLGTLTLLLVASLLVVIPAKAQVSADTERKVAALESQWLEAQKTSNPALLEPLLADTFFNVSTDSTVSNKAETLTLVHAAKFSSAEYLDVKVRVYSGTAIASGVFHGKGVDGSDVLERWTDTWARMSNGKWQCVASHASPMKK